MVGVFKSIIELHVNKTTTKLDLALTEEAFVEFLSKFSVVKKQKARFGLSKTLGLTLVGKSTVNPDKHDQCMVFYDHESAAPSVTCEEPEDVVWYGLSST